MNLTPRLAARWPWLVLASVLLFLGMASWWILQENIKEDLNNRRASSERELSTIAAFIASELQAGRYQDIEPLLRSWGEADAGIAHLQLAAANGFVLATYQRAGEVEHALTLEQPISYSYRGEARLHLRIDLADLYRHQRRLVAGISAIFAVVSLLLFYLVRVALQRQREAARLRQRTVELEQSEQRFRAVLENMQLIGVMLDRDGRIILCNDFLLHITGWQRAEVLHRSWFDTFLPPDIRDHIKESVFLETLRSGQGPAYFENEIITRRGERRLIAWNNTVLRDSRGQILSTASIGEDITEPRRAEKALHDTTERFSQALRAARAGAWEWNIITNQASWSEENFAVLGLDPRTHQASFENWLTCVHPEDRERASREIKEALDAGRDLNLEFRVVRPNGEVRWINDVGRLVFDETGKPTMMYGIQLDITARKQAQGETLRFGRILDESINEIYVFDVTTLRFSQVNFGARKNLGYSMQELSQLTPVDLKPEFTHASFEALLAPLKRGERDLLIFETVHRRKDGSLYPVEVHLQLSRHESPPVFVAVIQDITERKLAEELRAASDAQMRAIINASPVPKVLNDEHQNVTFLNPVFTETFGYTREDIPTLADWWHKAYPDPEYRQWVVETWQATLDKCQREGTAFPPMELNVRCKNGTVKTVLASAAPIGKSFAGVHLVVLYDITARKQSEEERARIFKELEQRNQEMESFVYTISHDLKSPLITISGFAHMLARDLEHGDKERGRESLEEIRKASQGMQQLIEDLLLLSRTGQIRGKPEDVDLRALVDDVLVRCASHIERERATIRVVSPLPRLHVDRSRFGQVFQNLLDNGVKFHREGVDPVLEIGAEQDAGGIRLYVRDNGIGIEKPYQEKIFELFQRLDTNREGTGVGLTIARRIIEQHGGKLWVESESGRGSTFWLSLPDSVIVDDGAGVAARGTHTLR